MQQYIPICTVFDRINKKRLLSEAFMLNRNYPRYVSYLDNYNGENLLESIISWKTYSSNMGDNIKQIVTNLRLMCENNDELNIDRALTFITKDIIPGLESPSFFKSFMESTKSNDSFDYCKKMINESIDTVNECDRIIKNFNTVSKRFNIKNVLTDGVLYKEDGISLTESIHTLCSLIDTYDMPMNYKFCNSAEIAFYVLEELDSTIDQKTILESIIDYYLEYYNSDFDSLYSNLVTSAQNNRFINESIVTKYLDELDKVNYDLKNIEYKDYDKIIMESYNTPYSVIDYINDQNKLSSSLKCIYEIALIDRIKENVSKLKLAPVKSLTTLKETLRMMLVTNRLQDLKNGTKNGLSLCFYLFITLGAFAIGGALTAALSVITSAIVSRHLDKEYLKTALREWREHKYAVMRKYNECTDNDKKMKLNKYLSEIDNNIQILEKEYESTRDKTSSELAAHTNASIAANGVSNSISHKINPIGHSVPGYEEHKNQDNSTNHVKPTDDNTDDFDNDLDPNSHNL